MKKKESIYIIIVNVFLQSRVPYNQEVIKMKKILSCFVFLMAGLAYSQGMKSLDLNITNENGQAIKTGFSLLCNAENIKQKDEIKDPLTKKAIKATCDIIDAMNKEDMKRLAELSYSQKEIDFYNQILQFQKITYKSDSVEFTLQVKLADKRLIFYRTFMEMNNMKIPVNQFTLLCEKDNEFVFVLPNDTESILATLISQSLDNPLHEDNRAPKAGETVSKLNITGSDCYLQFTSIPVKAVDVNNYNEENKHSLAVAHEIITWLKSSLNDLRNKTTEEYATSYYTKKSKKTFIDACARMQKEGLEIYVNRIVDGGYVIHYIIDAAPYYIVFYTQKENKLELSEKKTKKYNYVICLKENQKLKFTNYLRSNTFFDSLINKRIIDIDQLLDQEKITK